VASHESCTVVVGPASGGRSRSTYSRGSGARWNSTIRDGAGRKHATIGSIGIGRLQ
jgi:hypothetical protein